MGAAVLGKSLVSGEIIIDLAQQEKYRDISARSLIEQKQTGFHVKIGNPGTELVNVINNLYQLTLGLEIEQRLYRKKEVGKGKLLRKAFVGMRFPQYRGDHLPFPGISTLQGLEHIRVHPARPLVEKGMIAGLYRAGRSPVVYS